MTIFEFALYRAARQAMSPADVEIAQKAAELAERGEPGAAERLRDMVLDVLKVRRTGVVSNEARDRNHRPDSHCGMD